MNIKMKLLELGKTQTELLCEIHKRGCPTLGASRLSRIISGIIVNTPQSEKVMSLCEDILSEWKAELNAAKDKSM